MDPYSVLGVRKNASQTEIELAYKGRRSQYHPDRYATEDADTVAWATAQMQEVNKAYAVLTDPQARDRLHRKGPASASQPMASKPTQAGANRSMPRNLREHLLQHLHGSLGKSNVFAAPDIPHKKLHGALGSYGHGLRPGDVVLLVDDTVFGSAKDGMLVTPSEVRIKEIFQDPVRIPFSKIKTIHSGGNRLNINGKQVVKFNLPDAGEMSLLMAGLNDYLISARSTDEANTGDSERNTNQAKNKGESRGEEPEEGVIERFQKDLLRIRRADMGEDQEALLDLFDWLIRSTNACRQSLVSDGFELKDEEVFVLSSDVMRFELFPFVITHAMCLMLPVIGEAQAKEVISHIVDGVIVEIVIRKEGLDSIRRLSEAEKADRLMTRSCLIKPFLTRMVEYQDVVASDGDASSVFLKNLQEPMMGRLYEGRSREIVTTMIVDLIDEILDEETAEKALREVERCVEFAIKNYIGAMYE